MVKQNKESANNTENLLKIIKKNYISLILGFFFFLLLISFLTQLVNKKPGVIKSAKKEIINEQKKETENKKVNLATYKIKQNDNLWLIAENYYGTGFKYLEIAKANNIKDPNLIELGQELIIPKINTESPTKNKLPKEKEKIKSSVVNYKVKEGDHLWKIALEAYGDGYQWQRIAQANKIINPDLIVVGQILKIPSE